MSGGAVPAIRTAGLVKKFGSHRALDGLDLEVRTGEVHGFLGPNGAGKSTTIRVLLGLLRANGGTVELLGGDPWREIVRLHRRLAYVPGCRFSSSLSVGFQSTSTLSPACQASIVTRLAES